MTVMPSDGNWTVEDLDRLPDDGLQYELVDGVLLVTPAPVPRHQRAAREIFKLLDAATPPDLEVFFAPLDFRPTGRRSLQPDVLVVRRSDVGPTNITAPLVLAVEVLSPGTRAKDLMFKHGVYAESGVEHYWVVDPDQPSIRAWELNAGVYVEVAHVAGDEQWVSERPWQMTVVASKLTAG